MRKLAVILYHREGGQKNVCGDADFQKYLKQGPVIFLRLLSRTLQFASHLLQDSKSFQILLASEKLKDSHHSQDIFFSKHSALN